MEHEWDREWEVDPLCMFRWKRIGYMRKFVCVYNINCISTVSIWHVIGLNTKATNHWYMQKSEMVKGFFLKSKIHRVRICSQKPRVNLDLIVVFTRVFINDAIFFIRSFNLHFSKKLKWIMSNEIAQIVLTWVGPRLY